jgi:hypothetical protein
MKKSEATMFNTEISYLETFSSEPRTIILSDWLNAVKNGCKLKDQVLKYRETGDQQIKKSIPTVTVGAVCAGGHSMDNVKKRTGWIALDIDDDQNPEFTDWPFIRDQVGKLKQVAFSALSTSGRGVWALVRVSDPMYQDQYFDALQADFSDLGIVLDSTKGRNPNDKRFYSYDPGAIIKSDVKVYKKRLIPESKESPETLSIPYQGGKDVFSRGLNYVHNKGYTFTHGTDMHYSIFHLCCFLNFKGIPQREAEAWIDANVFPLHEIRSNCIDEPYKRYISNHGRGADCLSTAKSESEKSTDYGFNPFTGEIFDERGYPSDWDEIEGVL